MMVLELDISGLVRLRLPMTAAKAIALKETVSRRL